MNLNIRHCKKCGKQYDIGTNYNKCPKCRGCWVKDEVKKEEVSWK